MAVVLDILKNDPRSARLRHPEKAHRPDQPVQAKKPDWIRVKAPGSKAWTETQKIVREHGLVTVCEEAGCPNIGECWEKRHATFMIMGDTCTRACAFCNVRTGLPDALDQHEPEKIGDSVAKLGLLALLAAALTDPRFLPDLARLGRGGTADRPIRFPETRSMRRALPRRTAPTRSP